MRDRECTRSCRRFDSSRACTGGPPPRRSARAATRSIPATDSPRQASDSDVERNSPARPDAGYCAHRPAPGSRCAGYRSGIFPDTWRHCRTQWWLRARLRETPLDHRRIVDNPHSSPAAARRRLQQHGIADALGNRCRFRGRGHHAFGTGVVGTPASSASFLAVALSPIARIEAPVGPTKMKPSASTRSAKSAFSREIHNPDESRPRPAPTPPRVSAVRPGNSLAAWDRQCTPNGPPCERRANPCRPRRRPEPFQCPTRDMRAECERRFRHGSQPAAA